MSTHESQSGEYHKGEFKQPAPPLSPGGAAPLLLLQAAMRFFLYDQRKNLVCCFFSFSPAFFNDMRFFILDAKAFWLKNPSPVSREKGLLWYLSHLIH